MGKKILKKPIKESRKNTKREFEILGATSVAVTSILVISIFVASSLDVVIMRSQQYASVLSAVLVDMANQDRAENRLDGLTINPVLTKAAQLKANDMASKGYFAHTSPEGLDPWHWFEEAGYAFTYAGENLAVDFNDSSAVNAAWMNSPAHRANLLDQHFTEIGIATAEGFYQGHPTTYVVQVFGTPRTATVTTKPKITAAVPKSPTEIATAEIQEPAVLGEATSQTRSPQGEPVLVHAETQSVQASNTSAPLWAHIISSPERSLRYAYYGIGLCVLAALLFATGLELRMHHAKKALAAGAVLVTMAALFVIAGRIVFLPPVVPDASMTAAAAQFRSF